MQMKQNMYYKNIALDDVDEIHVLVKNISLENEDEKNMYNKKHCT